MADAAARMVLGSKISYTAEHGADARTYRVAFKRILTELRDWYQPQWDLDRGGAALVALFRRTRFTEEQSEGAESIGLRSRST